MAKFHDGQLLVGSSKKQTNIEVSAEGVGIRQGLKIVVTPWSSISEITIDGPSSKTSRVTATRLVALGVFALAAKKSTSETLVIITLNSGQVVTVMFTKKSEPEVKAIFAPYIGRIAKQAEPVMTKTELLKDLNELYKEGLISDIEFLNLKNEIMEL